MKFSFLCVALLAVSGLAAAAGYLYSPPEQYCAWGAELETTGVYTHTKTKYWVFGRYFKVENYDHNGDLVSARVYRPDILEDGMFWYNGEYCMVDYETRPASFSLADIFGESVMEFDFVEEGEFHGDKCMVYYNRNESNWERVVPDKSNAWYVDPDNGYLLGVVMHDDDWELRTEYVYTYHGETKVFMSDFTFSKSDVYRCPDDRVFHNPKAYWAQCGASTTSAALAVVLASILALLALVF